MNRPAPDLRRTWLFGPGADARMHDAMMASGADVLLLDLEDFTPAPRRDEARRGLAAWASRARQAGALVAVRINALDDGDLSDGALDLAAAMAAGPDVIAYPMADRPAQIRTLDAAISRWEAQRGLPPGGTEIVPVCETARGVVDVRLLAEASPRVRCALLGAEDLAADLCAQRQPDAVELDHARRRFVLECRAARIEPIDAPYTFDDVDGAVREALYASRLGYRTKAVVRPDHARAINAALTPSAQDVARASAMVSAFEAARARGEDRVAVDGLWVEVPTYRNALRLLDRARRLAGAVP